MKEKDIFDKDGCLTKEFLLSQKGCCKKGCKNCPYGYGKEFEKNGLKFKRPFRSELEKDIYDYFCQIPNLKEKVGEVDLTKMTGQDKKELIDKICSFYNLKKKSY